jgi:LPS sulfotransferase NodH
MMGKDKTRFMIVCAPRTGSTMLRLLLNSHSMICSHGEVFNQNTIFGFVGIDRKGEMKIGKIEPPIYQMLSKIRDKDPVQFLHEFVLYSGTFSAVGFKILYGTLWTSDCKSVFNEVLEDNDIKIVHLTRENRLRRFLSAHVTANVTGVTVALSEDEKPKVAKVSLSVDECISDMRRVGAEESRIRKEFSRHEVFEITHEEIVNSADSKLVELQKFLGVEPEPLTTPTVKLLSDDLRDIVENYMELCEAFRGTPHEIYLE